MCKMNKLKTLRCKSLAFFISLQAFFYLPLSANSAKDSVEADRPEIENDVVSLADREGFRWKTKRGDFIFKPYMLVQTNANFNWYDDEGLDPAYNQDNVSNSGFAIPNAILGFTGKAFDIVTFNLSLNAAKGGGELLQQAWFDVYLKQSVRFRIGKFKTPYTNAYLTTLGETLMPAMPVSLTASTLVPHSLNATNPPLATGFDIGVMMHGVIDSTWLYQVGVFNGTGSSVNGATKTLSDDYHIPSLLYAARWAFMPNGVMPSSQGSPNRLDENKVLVALSANYNVESENESANDFRAGMELAWLFRRFYFSAELCFMNMKFTKRQQISKAYNFLGGYAQAGYFFSKKLQGALRYDFYNRNGLDTDGFINLPAAGVNYFISSCNLKLQAMYQYMGRWGHETQLDRDNDDLGLATHSAMVSLQYSF